MDCLSFLNMASSLGITTRCFCKQKKKNLKSLTLHVMYYFRENENSLFSLRTHSFSYRGHRPLLHQIPEVNHHCTGNRSDWYVVRPIRFHLKKKAKQFFLLHVAQCKKLIKLIVIVQSDFFCLLCSILKFTIIIYLWKQSKNFIYHAQLITYSLKFK